MTSTPSPAEPHDDASEVEASDAVDGSARDDGAGADVAPRISELRLVIEANDLDAAIRFYRDALGLPLREGYASGDAAQLVLDAGRASIELVHPELPAQTDAAGSPMELDSPPAPKLRLSFRSDDPVETVRALDEAGAERVVAPRLTTAGSITTRYVGPDHMPVTIYQPLSGPDFVEDAHSPS